MFPRREALALALAHSPGLYDLAAIESAFAELERDRHLIPAIRRGVGEAWTTARAVNAEREVIERMRAGIGAVGPLNVSPITGQALEGLTDGQRAAARLILTSPDRTVGVQGYAGTGKTVMLRRVVALAGNRRVVGLAPSASAARTLARETGLGCRTLQWFLARCREVADGVADTETLDALKRRYAGAVVIVDEMSLAGTAQARALLRIAERLDVARLVLVGDSRQLRAVEAGQPFRQLQDASMATAVMDEVRRQRDPDLKAAVLDMIDGRTGRGARPARRESARGAGRGAGGDRGGAVASPFSAGTGRDRAACADTCAASRHQRRGARGARSRRRPARAGHRARHPGLARPHPRASG